MKSREEVVVREQILQDIRSIDPFDALEAEHRRETIDWVESGAELARLKKPDTPPKHLVSYFLLVDGEHYLLVEHRNAGLWLPTGGHVEPGERPIETARREAKEELGITPRFLADEPLFVTSTKTVGRTAGHTDVSLWFVVLAEQSQRFDYDRNEFKSVRWFHRDELPLEQCDPHMGRFVEKLERRTNIR